MRLPARLIMLFALFGLGLVLLSRLMPSGNSDVVSFYPVKVMQIIATRQVEVAGVPQVAQTLKLRVLNGSAKDREFIVEHGSDTSLSDKRQIRVNDRLVLAKEQTEQGEVLRIADRYRLPGIGVFILLFIAVVLLFAGVQGVGALVGLVVSAFIILWFVVPQIIQGSDPLLISLIGATVILLVTMYLAHGFRTLTTIAVVATALTLAIAGVLSYLAVTILQLTGGGSEEANLLRLGSLAELNLEGLLLGGMILGILGILDDVTTSQVAAVFAIAKENNQLTSRELIIRGLSVGREHIASLVNTLVLAYAGVSFPLFFFFLLNPMSQPAWVIFNSEFMAEEIVRTIAGSVGLVLGVPVATILASFGVRYIRTSRKVS